MEKVAKQLNSCKCYNNRNLRKG